MEKVDCKPPLECYMAFKPSISPLLVMLVDVLARCASWSSSPSDTSNGGLRAPASSSSVLQWAGGERWYSG